jgi:hypothetical protein
MNLKRFTLREIFLEVEGERLDLHNCFDFLGFTYEVSSRELSLRWRPNQYAPPDERRHIRIYFQGVSHVSVEPRDTGVPFTEDDCLSFVGYASPDSPVGEAIMLDQPTPDMHLVFCFMSQMRLRVYADHAHLTFSAV